MDNPDEQARERAVESRRELEMLKEERLMARGAREMEHEMQDFEDAEARVKGRVRAELAAQRAHSPDGRSRVPASPSQVESEVRTALRRDPRIERPELIAVSVDGIGAVELRGAVPTPEQRLAAAHSARGVPGVFEVIDDGLKVHLPIRPRRADDEIRVEAIEQLTAERFRGAHLRVKVHQGDVTLRGYVWHDADASAAVDLVSKLQGVGKVSDQIKVRRAMQSGPRPSNR